ncbi:MAG: DUF58 domain-containing protein [Treponema sp.]|nr:DUF58 domain-containing protein [Treponema sp.]
MAPAFAENRMPNPTAFRRLVSDNFFFTPVGAAFFIITLIVLIRSLFNRNYYEIVLSCAALLFLLLTGIIGFWKSRKSITMEPAWKPPFPMTAQIGNLANAEDETLITGLDVSVPLFFRLHYIIKGRFFPCGSKQSCYVSAETSVPRGKTQAQMPLNFPMSGILRAQGYCRLRDIFGFFSFRCGQAQHRAVNVRCSPCFGKKTHINAQTGAEDRRNKPSADVERYYMREYAPGDRLRDINWKSSDKLDELITRISTDNQEKINRLEVHFRNYTSIGTIINISKSDVKTKEGEPSLEALWLLDRAKARLTYFLRSLMEQNSSFVFDIHSPSGDWEIEDDKDLDAFLEELAVLSFMPPQNEADKQTGKDNIYIFSTACDFGLNRFLLSNNQRPVTIFLIQPSDKKFNAEIETLRIRDFTSRGCIPSSGWLGRGQYDHLHGQRPYGKLNPLSVGANKAEMFYAEIKL